MLKKFFKRTNIKALFFIYLSLNKSSYLNKKEWYNTYVKISKNKYLDNPIPWLTYPFIDFIEKRLSKNMVVFEYGAGSSTIWFSKRVGKVCSVENNLDWYGKISNRVDQNVEISYITQENADEYCNKPNQTGNQFDVILIDGKHRVKCAFGSLKALKQDGVIIWDDAERENYDEGINYLMENGFKRLDFIGMRPLSIHESVTSVFYRSNNCLMI